MVTAPVLGKDLVEQSLELVQIKFAVLILVEELEHVRRLVKSRRAARELVVQLDAARRSGGDGVNERRLGSTRCAALWATPLRVPPMGLTTR